MKRYTYSPTYVALLDLLFKTKTIKVPNTVITQENGRFVRTQLKEESDRISQDFYVAASELWAKCTPHEWYLIGRISSELKKFNALWHCDPVLKGNGALKKSIAGLLRLGVLIKTETHHIYIVNPIYVRRGDFFTVLNTTAELLMDASKVTEEHIIHRKPIKDLDLTPHGEMLRLDEPNTTIG